MSLRDICHSMVCTCQSMVHMSLRLYMLFFIRELNTQGPSYIHYAPYKGFGVYMFPFKFAPNIHTVG